MGGGCGIQRGARERVGSRFRVTRFGRLEIPSLGRWVVFHEIPRKGSSIREFVVVLFQLIPGISRGIEDYVRKFGGFERG